MTYVVQKRVANTEHWGTVASGLTRDEVVSRAKTVEGGKSTGVRIVADSPYAEPEIIVGC